MRDIKFPSHASSPRFLHYKSSFINLIPCFHRAIKAPFLLFPLKARQDLPGCTYWLELGFPFLYSKQRFSAQVAYWNHLEEWKGPTTRSLFLETQTPWPWGRVQASGLLKLMGWFSWVVRAENGSLMACACSWTKPQLFQMDFLQSQVSLVSIFLKFWLDRTFCVDGNVHIRTRTWRKQVRHAGCKI